MKMVKKIGILTGMFLLAVGVSVGQAQAAENNATARVAVVNVQQVLQQSPRVAELSKKLESQFKARQAKLNDEQKALQDQSEKFKKDSTTMSQKDRDALQKTITAKRSDLMKDVVAYQQDLQKEQNKIMQSILNDLNSVVSAIAKAQNYSLVLDSQAVVFVPEGTDIKKEVAKQFNNKA